MWRSSTGGSRRENHSSGGTGFRESWWVRRRKRRKRRSKRRWQWEGQTGHHRELGSVCMGVSSLSIPLREEGNWVGRGRSSALGLAFLKEEYNHCSTDSKCLATGFILLRQVPPVPRLGAWF